MAETKLPPPIALCYGTFDLLHEGHRHLLREARKHGDFLIVVIDSDRYARELKGPGRPVEDLAVRSHNLIATGLVHLVLGVDSADQLIEAVEYYTPDFLVTGDAEGAALDAGSVAQVPTPRKTAVVVGDGPGVVLVPLLPGHSTSAAIKERMQ